MERGSSARPADEIERTVRKYGDMLYGICLFMLKNESDAEDAVQDTVLRYIRSAPQFESAEHEKAGLIRVAVNRSRDILRHAKRHPELPLNTLKEQFSNEESCGVLEALMAIPESLRIVMLLHYVEEYRVSEIAKIIGKSPSAVKMRLQKGRRLLLEEYEKEYL